MKTVKIIITLILSKADNLDSTDMYINVVNSILYVYIAGKNIYVFKRENFSGVFPCFICQALKGFFFSFPISGPCGEGGSLTLRGPILTIAGKI